MVTEMTEIEQFLKNQSIHCLLGDNGDPAASGARMAALQLPRLGDGKMFRD
jgi:hypothetical protein